MTLRVVSFGGGVQSTALLVLAAQERIEFRSFLFANVGDHAENPDTLAYVEQVARPYADDHGIELAEIRWTTRAGKVRDLYDDLLVANDIPIPVRFPSGAFGHRNCTRAYKIVPVARELRRRGATVDDPAVIALGISVDEIERAKPGIPAQQPWTTRTFPLLDLGLSRRDCRKLIDTAGLPVPPKSACWFCPYSSTTQWRDRRQRTPELFESAVDLERTLSDRNYARTGLGAGLASGLLTLDQAVDDQLALPGMDECDSGWCMT